MSGALINLVSSGVQNAFLNTSKLTDSLFRSNFTRITNFSHTTHELPIHGSVVQGGRSSIEILKKGDIINGVWFETANAYTALSGSQFELYIGGKLIDSQTVDWSADIWQIYLADTPSKSATINNAASASDPNFLPLHFFFCDNKQFLPLVNLQYQTVEIIVKWGPGATPGIKCWGNYVYLDTHERERMARKSMDVMITQVQKIDSQDIEIFDISSFNHPIKALFWGYPTKSDEIENDYLTFTGAKLQLNGQDLSTHMSPSYYHTVQSYYRTQNALVNFIEQERCPLYTRYYLHSFAETCSLFDNTGTCNFSRLDNAVLRIQGLQKAPTRTAEPLSIYALGFNVLRFQSGLAGILFSN